MKRLDSKKIYELLYEQMVKPCVELIEQEKYQETLELYYDMTNQFKSILLMKIRIERWIILFFYCEKCVIHKRLISHETPFII